MITTVMPTATTNKGTEGTTPWAVSNLRSIPTILASRWHDFLKQPKQFDLVLLVVGGHSVSMEKWLKAAHKR